MKQYFELKIQCNFVVVVVVVVVVVASLAYIYIYFSLTHLNETYCVQHVTVAAFR